MEILKRLVDSQKVAVGLRLKDTDGYEFYIRMSSLHNPEILKALRESGWDLYGLPYDIRNNGMSIDSLPAVDISSINFTPEETQEMEDYDATRLSDKDLFGMIKPSEKMYQFKEGNYIIHTREELKSFLTGIQKRLTRNAEGDDFSLYVPLNSFVAPSARFTLEEYFAQENAEFRDMIEKRRALSFLNFKKLQMFFMELGLEEDFDAKMLLDFYFSWGICGLNLNVQSLTETKELRALTGLSDGVGDTRVYAYTTGYLKADGKVLSDLDVRVSATMGEYRKLQIRDTLTEEGSSEKDIFPLEVRYPIYEKRTLMVGPDLSLEYSLSVIRIHYKRSRYVMNTLTVSNPVNRRLPLQFRCWNLNDNNALLDEMRLHLLCKQLQENVRVVTDASSMKALMSLGVSPMNAFNYILNQIDLASAFAGDDDEEGKALTFDPKQLIADYLKDTLDENDPQYSAVSDFVFSVMEGIINVDDIHSGTQMDEFPDDNLPHIITAARKYLGLSWAQIEESVNRINTEYTELVFESPTLRIRYNVALKNNRSKAFNSDMRSYTIKRAQTVLYVTRVVKVLTEPYCDGYSPRHCAAIIEAIPIENQKANSTGGTSSNKYMEEMVKRLIKMVKDKLIEVAPHKAPGLSDLAEPWVIHSFFDIAYNGEIRTLVPTLGEEAIIKVPKEYQDFLRARIFTRCDSLITLCDNVLDNSGRFILVNVNASITPNFVIPFKGVTIETAPFRFYYANTAHFPRALKEQYVAKGWIPNVEHSGLVFTYGNNRIIPQYKQVVDPTKIEGYSMVKTSGDLDKYMAAIEDNLAEYKRNPEGMFTMYPDTYSELYPIFSEFYPTDIKVDESAMSTDPSYNTGTPGVIDRESVLARSEYARSLHAPAVAALTTNTASVYPGIVYSYEDIKNAENLEATKLYSSFTDDRIKVVAVTNRKNIYFADNTVVTADEVPNMDLSKYSIERVSPNMHIVADIHGTRFTVRAN